MRFSALLLTCAACAASPPAARPGPGGSGGPPPSPSVAGGAALRACDAPWSLGVIGGGAQVVVVCSSDVRREPLDPAGPLAPSLAAGLDPARDRVCSCAKQGDPPPFVDLVFTAKPDQGSVTVQAKDEDTSSLAAGEGAPAGPFVACVGTIEARFPPKAVPACGEGAAATIIYPVRLELGP